ISIFHRIVNKSTSPSGRTAGHEQRVFFLGDGFRLKPVLQRDVPEIVAAQPSRFQRFAIDLL
ncbi:MAG: hypothetical protein JJU20_14255, partial [Opitutales bacterium]|nr:hypothetical protein [Opitutales bacterium]